MYSRCSDSSGYPIIQVNFGRVAVGVTITKSVRIVNDDCNLQSYEARRDTTTNPLDCVFTLEKHTWTCPPGGTFECKIQYRPTVSFCESREYFTIVQCNLTHRKIAVRGISIGPKVLSATPKVVLVCPRRARTSQKRVRFSNESQVRATFAFDIDEKQCPFRLDVTNGFIEPRGHANVVITFSPPEPGIYAFHLPCMVQHQGPVITELLGHSGSLIHEKENLPRDTFDCPRLTGFESYMNGLDVVLRGEERRPMITLSPNYLDFGRASVEPEGDLRRTPRIVCLINHSRNDLSIKWDKDVEEVFHVEPRLARVPARESTLFEFNFAPNKENAFFARELLVRGFDNFQYTCGSVEADLECVAIPLVTSIRMIGQSFAAGSVGWLPQYEVPRTVVLPPCVPSLPAYTTFLIKRHGHLPLMFHFLPPSTSRFIVKPMLGVIYGNYQVIALEMVPEVQDEPMCEERWVIQFNGNSKSEASICFKGFAEYPNLSFNDDRVVEFPPVYPGCEEVRRVIVRNLTQHRLLYSFPDVPEELTLQSTNGEIRTNETLTHSWTFHPSEVGEYSFDVLCRVTALLHGHPAGRSVDIAIRAVGRSERGFLIVSFTSNFSHAMPSANPVPLSTLNDDYLTKNEYQAMPTELNFGAQACNEARTLSFHAFNFSAVRIHFQMTCTHLSWPFGLIHRDVRIHPAAGTIQPGGKERIDIRVEAREPTFYELSIQYAVRPRSLTNDPIPCAESREICRVTCDCVLPTLKVIDLLYHDTGPNVSKILLWKIMNINELNSTLQGLAPGEKKMINLHFPARMNRHEPLSIKLLMINPTLVTTSWTLKRTRLCSCRKVTTALSFSLRKTEYHCEHRRVCSIEPKTGTLKPRETAVMAIVLSYTLPGTTELQWDLILSDDRHVLLQLTVVCLTEMEREDGTGMLVEGPRLSFDKIYIGDADPIYQVYWMRNNANYEVEFSLDTRPIEKINEAQSGDVFSCMAPTRGLVKAQSCKAIAFRFQPRRLDRFKVTIPLMVGNSKTYLELEGESHCRERTYVEAAEPPFRDKIDIEEAPVQFNRDYITLSSLSTHSKITRVVMIRNGFKEDAIAYEWKNYVLPGLLRVDVHPRKGTVVPGVSQSVCLTVVTGGFPCRVDADVTCEFVNSSDRRAYERSRLVHDALRKELEGQFIITEKGTTVPEPQIESIKKPLPFQKSVTVRCYVYGLRDEDVKTTLEEQLRGTPGDEIRLQVVNEKSESSVATNETINAATFILEGMIWELLNSRAFENTLRETLNVVPDFKYSQFAMNPLHKKTLVERSCVTPPLRYFETLLERMIFMIVHEEFALETTHLSEPSVSDIRQMTYRHMRAEYNHSRKTDSNLATMSTLLVGYEEKSQNGSRSSDGSRSVAFEVPNG